MDPYGSITTRVTPQTEQADTRQERNNAGGFGFVLDDAARLRRFLVLGTEGGTYYATQKALTKDSAEVVIRLARTSPKTVIDTVLELDVANRAPKHDPLLLALAAVAGLADVPYRRAAFSAMHSVARTGTHVLTFARYLEQFRGWGRSARTGVASWFEQKEARDLAYQVVKYQQRDGWAQRDLLRLAHPSAPSPEHAAVYQWITKGEIVGAAPDVLRAFEQVKDGRITPAQGIERGLPWEALPSESLTDIATWLALIDKGMPMTALIRNLPRLTTLGVFNGARLKTVAAALENREAIRKSRVHPYQALVALRTYASGRSFRGSSSWSPNGRIVDALDAAFYASFANVEPTGKRTLLALDVSGSMTWDSARIQGGPVTAAAAAAAMAMVTARTEPDYRVMAFSNTFESLPITPRQRLDDVLRMTEQASWKASSTDCAVPMLWALDNGVEVDTFVVYTDNETWYGRIHPFQALQTYRKETGINAKLVVVSITPTSFSIADPKDPGMLDVSGFDSATPQFISDFSAGRV
jgi:60 kDa SS-A/Ro ribonucleoprotein